MTLIAAADGSALGNPGPAGWAWYVDADRWASGGWDHGTNNMGELTAVLDLLQQTADLDDDLLVYCDSTYAINVVTKWMRGWKRKGWRKGDGKPVLNLDIIKALDDAMRPGVEFRWVKGHAGHDLNEAADRLANAAAVAHQEGRTPDPGPGLGPGRPARSGHAFAVTTQPVEADLFSELDGAPTPTDEEQVVTLERSLLLDEVREDPASVAALLHPQWSEIGRSGRLWTREEILAEIGPLTGDPTTLDVVSVERLAPDVVLLVWRALGLEGSTLRSSVWVRESGSWRQRFHQGTAEA